MSSMLRCADLAAEQWGLVTTAQVRTLGVSAQTVARLTGQGALERVTHGVYRVTGTPPAPLDDLRAAWLTLDPARRAGERLRGGELAVVSHRSAAAIHELGDLETDESEFTIGTRKQTRRPGVRIHRRSLEPREWTVRDGLPVTTVVRTVADLAADRVDGGHLATVVRDALTRRHIDDRQLIEVLRHHAHHYGAPTGDGAALLARFLGESGVPRSIGRAVELAGTGFSGPATTSHSEVLRRLEEQLADIQYAVTSAVRIGEHNATASALNAAADLVDSVQSSNLFRQLAEQHAEVAEMSRLARRVSESLSGLREQQESGE